jgi:hypothetical protein
MEILPPYTHIINRKLKHTYLSLGEHGNLIVKSPALSVQSIEKILLKRLQWIQNAQKCFHEKKGRYSTFSQKNQLYFLGIEYPLELVASNKTQLTFNQDKFILYYQIYDTTIFRKHINNFYRKEAIQYILPLVKQWAETMQCLPVKVSFRKTKRQWGSCSGKDYLSFNTMIMKTPKDAIIYVVIHELAHIKYKHHQKDFWDFVSSHMPNYKEKQVMLNQYVP